MRIDADELHEPERVFVAWSLKAAKRAEELLTQNGVDYVVEVEQLGRSFLFGAPRHAAVFYVGARQAAYCREALTSSGLGKGVIDDGAQ